MTSVSPLAALFVAQAPPAPNPMVNLVTLILPMIVIFYFLILRPQQKQRKEHAARLAALQTGDKVVTSAGIYGIVHNIKEATVVLKVAEGTMIEFDKAAVTTVSKKEAK